MHELSIAQSLIQLACEHAEQNGAHKVRRISVRLGVLSGMLRSLYICFGSASKGTGCEGAVLEIEEVPLTVYCGRCDQTRSPGSRYSFACPYCSTPTPDIVTGREMQLVAIELDRSEKDRVGSVSLSQSPLATSLSKRQVL